MMAIRSLSKERTGYSGATVSDFHRLPLDSTSGVVTEQLAYMFILWSRNCQGVYSPYPLDYDHGAEYYSPMARILLIDDEEQVLKSLGMLLNAQGHEVVPIKDSTKAENAIRNEECDLIITDIRMAPVDGMELLRIAGEAKPNVPTIVISAYTSEHTIKQSMDIGCTAYIKKPFQIQEVLDAVNSCLAQE